MQRRVSITMQLRGVNLLWRAASSIPGLVPVFPCTSKPCETYAQTSAPVLHPATRLAACCSPSQLQFGSECLTSAAKAVAQSCAASTPGQLTTPPTRSISKWSSPLSGSPARYHLAVASCHHHSLRRIRDSHTCSSSLWQLTSFPFAPILPHSLYSSMLQQQLPIAS